ncbi:hypothetical protein HanRHA438_Chr01g0035601 [Helianthus annuus]|nr:hypothetical protein HanRHA438_Chr01g0035601 [Helianthus annuus]
MLLHVWKTKLRPFVTAVTIFLFLIAATSVFVYILHFVYSFACLLGCCWN